jgi:hypothetical protein
MLLKPLNRHRLLGRHKRFCRKLSKQVRHLSRLMAGSLAEAEAVEDELATRNALPRRDVRERG